MTVRVHHPSFRGVTYVVELEQDYESPMGYACNACNTVHQKKAIHLRLNADGDAFVSEGILELLRKVPTMAGLTADEARAVPEQVIGAVEQPKQHIILPHGEKYVPGWNKYQAAERMQRPFTPVAEAIAERIDRAATAAKAEKSSTFIMGRRK